MAEWVEATNQRKGGDYVARTLAGVSGALEQAMYNEEQARLPGLLQKTDPRAKVVLILLLIGAAALAHHLATVAVAYGVTLVLAHLSRLALPNFVKRCWLGIPIFAGVIVLPALVLIPGQPLLLLDVPPLRLAITDNSLASATIFVARVGASVSLAVLLVSTTRWTDLLRALGSLHVPEAFVVVLGMTYRYLFLLLHTTNNLFLARASRTVGVSDGAEQRRWAAGAVGVLVSRSVKLSGDVHLAMRARGFAGEIHTLHDFAMRDEDWLLLALGAVVTAALLLLDGRLA